MCASLAPSQKRAIPTTSPPHLPTIPSPFPRPWRQPPSLLIPLGSNVRFIYPLHLRGLAIGCLLVGPTLYTLNSVISTPFNVTHSLLFRNPGGRMFVVQISFLTVIFLSLVSRISSSMQTTKEVNPHPRIAPCVNMWSAIFFFFFFFLFMPLVECWCMHTLHRLGRLSGVGHTGVSDGRTNSNYPHISFVLFHNVTYYTNSKASHIRVNTTKLRNMTCTLVATSVKLRSLKCSINLPSYLSRLRRS